MIMEKPLYLEETKDYLTTKLGYKDLSLKYGCSSTTMSNRIKRTISRLVDYFDFDNLKIDYPKRSGDWNIFRSCKKYAEFWLNVISNYEAGLTAYDYAKAKNSSGDITIAEMIEFFKAMQDSVVIGWAKNKQIDIAITGLLYAEMMYKELLKPKQ